MNAVLIGTSAVVLLTALGCAATGGRPELPGVRLYERTLEGVTMRAAVYVPPALHDVPPGMRPGLLFLHGYGESGTDGTRQLVVGLPPAAFLDAEAYPFVIIAPQKPLHDAEWEAFEALVLEVLDAGVDLGGVDPRRVAITGLSQGGHGTIAFATRHADRFVAAAPVCGYIKPRFYEDGQRPVRAASAGDAESMDVAARAGHLPWRIYHGAQDSVIPIDESRVLRDVLAGAGADVELTEYEDLDHNSWDRAYRDSDLAAWLRDQLRAGG